MKDQQYLDIILKRGTENIIPNAKDLEKKLTSDQKLNVYLGIDPTATQIHLGHAVPLRKLQAFAELGHTVYFLIGDFTALIGDTSDKNSERPVLTSEEIQQNFQTYKAQASKILDFSKVKVVHNSEWLNQLGFADILNLTRQFSVNDFISRELIRNRIEEGKRVGLAEMLYPLMQGYDSYHLDTDVQLGGTDQTFNMQAGRTLLKNLNQKDSFILANGFLLGTDGRKMSKSWGNAIWLNDTPEDMYGKTMSVQDELVRDYFTLATQLPLAEIDQLLAAHQTQPMELKKKLAHQIVTELHDEPAAQAAAEHFAKTVQHKEAPDDIQVVTVTKSTLTTSELVPILTNAGTVSSNSEARRLLDQQAIYLENEKIVEDEIKLQPTNTIRVGKRKYLQINVKS